LHINISILKNAISQPAEACEKALKINANYELAKNNLAWAKSNL